MDTMSLQRFVRARGQVREVSQKWLDCQEARRICAIASFIKLPKAVLDGLRTAASTNYSGDEGSGRFQSATDFDPLIQQRFPQRLQAFSRAETSGITSQLIQIA